MNHFQVAILLATVLFGGHAALHRWDLRKTRREMLQRACRAPEHVARAWAEGGQSDGSVKLWLQFNGKTPHMVALGRKACAEALGRLRAAGIGVETDALQPGVSLAPEAAQRLPGQPRASRLSGFSSLS